MTDAVQAAKELARLSAKELRQRVGRNICAERKRLGMGPVAFSRLMGCGMMTIWRWEHGRTDMPLSTIGRVADALGVPVSRLMLEPEPEPVSEPAP